MATILVSGGGGYVGRFIVEGLLANGHEVIVTGRKPPDEDYFSKPVTFVPGTLEPAEIDPGQFMGVDHFVHAAFHHEEGKYRGGEGADPEGFLRRNVDGSIALFRAAKAAGVKRVVFLSSRAVYGLRPEGAALFETTEPEPETLYGMAKLDAERALLAIADGGLQPIVLRITGVYGPAGPRREHKWSGLIHNVVSGLAVMERVATEVHGDDVAAAVALLLGVEGDRMSDPVFNVSDLVVDRADLVELVSERAGKQLAPCPRSDASGLNIMDTHRLQALGWRPGGWSKLRDTVHAMADAALRDQ